MNPDNPTPLPSVRHPEYLWQYLLRCPGWSWDHVAQLPPSIANRAPSRTPTAPSWSSTTRTDLDRQPPAPTAAPTP